MNAAVPDGFGETLAEDAPDVSIADALAILRRHYSLIGSARPLPGERDHNFHVQTEGDGEFVLKVSHPAEEAGFTDFQGNIEQPNDEGHRIDKLLPGDIGLGQMPQKP